MNAAQQAKESRTRRRILLVDDSLDNVRSLAMLFDTMGHHVDYAINATAAIDLAQRFQPDVIFLDLLLPDEHGAGVCRELKALPALKQTRIIAVTASSRMLDHQMALDAGCDDVLRKPVSPETYERLIAGGMCRRKLRQFIAEQTTDEAAKALPQP